MKWLGVATVASVSLIAPQAAQAFCTQVYNSGYYDSTSAHGETLVYFDPWMNSDCAGLDPWSTYVYYDWVSTSIQGPVGSETGPSSGGEWWVQSSVDIPIIYGGFGQYVINGGGDEHICSWYWYQCYNETVVGWASYDVYVPSPTVTLSASNYAPVVGSGPVQIWAQFDPSWIYPEFGAWEACTPQSEVECSFSPDTPGIATVTYSTFVVNVLVGAQVQIDVQQPQQQQPQLYLIVDSDWNLDQGIVGEPEFRPGSYPNGSSRPVEELATQGGQLAQLFAYFAFPNTPNQMVTPPPGVSTVTFSLQNTTAFLGFASNAGTSTDHDYTLMSFGDSQETQVLADVPVESGLFFHVLLWIKDYGGRAVARVEAPNGPAAELQLPVDVANGGNDLPDVGWWAGAELVTDAGAAGDDDDGTPSADGDPPIGFFGDGLMRFEEYRGFVVSGSHRRTHPARKDLFVSSNGLVDIGFATNLQALGMGVHRIVGEDNPPPSVPEYRLTDRVMNANFQNLGIGGDVPNRTEANGQRALRILSLQEFLPLSCLPLGQIFMIDGTPILRTPNETDRIEVYPSRHHMCLNQPPFSFDLSQRLNEERRTLGHEVGHGIHICHRMFENMGACPSPDPGIAGTGFSIMDSEPPTGEGGADPGSRYNVDDERQIRLHLRY